jgi:hypothetical protein
LETRRPEKRKSPCDERRIGRLGKGERPPRDKTIIYVTREAGTERSREDPFPVNRACRGAVEREAAL